MKVYDNLRVVPQLLSSYTVVVQLVYEENEIWWYRRCFPWHLKLKTVPCESQHHFVNHSLSLLLTDKSVGDEKGECFLHNYIFLLLCLLMALRVLVSVARFCSNSAPSGTSGPRFAFQNKSWCVVSRTLSLVLFSRLHYCFSLYCLQVCFNMGQITLAKKLARRALRLLKRSFPWTWLGVIFQTFLEKCWYSCSLSQPRNNPSEKWEALPTCPGSI